jgi:hypothetical protein
MNNNEVITLFTGRFYGSPVTASTLKILKKTEPRKSVICGTRTGSLSKIPAIYGYQNLPVP